MPAPPSVPPPRRPGLARTSPERLERDVRLAAIFRRWVRRLGIPLTELADAWHISERVVRDLLIAEKALHASDILLALPDPYRRRFLEEVDRERSLLKTGTDHG